MVTQKFTASPSTYRVDVERGEQSSIYHVVRCEPVAKFENEEHAAFLVDLLTKGGAQHG